MTNTEPPAELKNYLQKTKHILLVKIS